MSDRSGTTRAILSGLAVGAILGAPAAAAAAGEPSTAESIAVTSTCPSPPPADEVRGAAATIRGQFEASFTAGAVTAPVAETVPIICAG